MSDYFDIEAERKYYKQSPTKWNPASPNLVEKLMSLTAGDNWVEFLDDKKVLELGAGECSYLPYLLSKATPLNYIATDIFEDRFLPAKKALQDKYANLIFKEVRADQLEIEDKDFDAILAFGLYHHLPDLKSAFCQARAVLKKDGYLILRDPYAGNPLIKFKYSLIGRSENEWPLGMKRTKKALIESGFELVRVNRFWIRFPDLSGGPWSTNIGFVAKAL